MLDGDTVERQVPNPATDPSRRRFDIRFPGRDEGLDQDEEWCEVGYNGTVERIRFHDYHEVYAVPGLYEQIFYDELECESPQVVCGLLIDELRAYDQDASDLRVLDVGAGNGMVGEELAKHGTGSVSGVDIIQEAADAQERDRPSLYDDYFVLDLTDIPADDRTALEAKSFNCLTLVAALGFGDIPPLAFAEAYNLVEDGGWIAFNIKEDFLGEEDKTGFSQLIDRMLEEGILDRGGERRYRHRLSMARDPLHYIALAAVKRADVPLEWCEGLND